MSTKKSSVSSIKGFTLVELLIVVAIIGVLASQGVPAYRRMIQKSRKGEAQVLLGNVSTAESGFFSEYGQYTNNIARAGAQSEGSTFLYAAGFPVDSASCGHFLPAAIVPTQGNGVGQVPNLPNNWNTGIPGPSNPAISVVSMVGKVGGYVAAGGILGTNCGKLPQPGFGAGTVGVAPAPALAYIASATGNVEKPTTPCGAEFGALTSCDIWYINENRLLVNVFDGVRN